MKCLITLFLCIVTLNPLFAQDEKDESNERIEISQKDSSNNYLAYLEQNNKQIANAYNGLSIGLKSSAGDSVMIMTNQYREIVEGVITNTELITVAPHLSGIKNAYLEWIKSLKDFCITNSYKLIEYDLNKRSALSHNPEADTKYIDKQISDFFEEMDNAQNQWRTHFVMERTHLNELPEPPTEIKK